jgi:hypothetical protein
LRQGLIRREKRQWRASHFLRLPALRHRRDASRRDYSLLRQRAPGRHSHIAAQHPDGFADPHTGDIRPDGQHFAHAIAAQDVRQGRVGRIHGARQKSVGGIQSGELNPNEHFARPGLRVRRLPQLHLLDAFE